MQQLAFIAGLVGSVVLLPQCFVVAAGPPAGGDELAPMVWLALPKESLEPKLAPWIRPRLVFFFLLLLFLTTYTYRGRKDTFCPTFFHHLPQRQQEGREQQQLLLLLFFEEELMSFVVVRPPN